MPKSPPPGDPQPEELDFETAFQRLEATVAELEGGQLGLEESLARFEEAMKLRDLCARKLKEAEARVEEYTARAEAAAEPTAEAEEDEEEQSGLFEDL